jgi:hypothetical protein
MTSTDQVDSDQFFHGGVPDLNVGDRLVPRKQLPYGHFDRHSGVTLDPTDPGRVYVTTRRDIARAYAIRYANTPPHLDATLYRVRVPDVTELEPDPDLPGAGAFAAPWAEVVEVCEKRVPGGAVAAQRVLGPLMTWTDGSPIFDRQGYMLPAPEWVGVTARELRVFGRWIHADSVRYNRGDRRMYRAHR